MPAMSNSQMTETIKQPNSSRSSQQIIL